MILVMRCDEGPAYVPSDVVNCSHCGAECWLSKYSGPSTRALARFLGSEQFACRPCFERIARAAGVPL